MSNANVNAQGKIHGGGSPKPTNDGKDLGPDATNSMGKFKNKPLSPNANANSRNK